MIIGEAERNFDKPFAIVRALVYSETRKMKSADRDRKSPTIIIRSFLERLFKRVRGGPDDY